jgi:tetratricopeptide (TPR) repeat protein
LLADLLISDYLHGWNGAGPGERQAAERAADDALKLNPQLALAHYAKGFVFRSKGQHDKAIEAFDQAIAADPQFAPAYAQKAGELLNDGRSADDALALIDRAIGMVSPGHESLGTFHWIRGRICFFKEDYPEAIKGLKESVRLRADDWYNRAYLAAAYFLSGDPKNATDELQALDARLGRYSVAKVIANENANPNSHSDFGRMRRRLHEALEKAGMPAS